MAANYIMTIEGLTKIYDEKEILKNIWLSFYPGAKIGVLGSNGAGKSTLLRIMAGEDKNYEGEVRPAKGIKIGFFHQEPKLDPDQTVGESIAEAVADSQAILDRYNDVNMQLGEDLTREEMDKVLEEQGCLQDKIDANNLWDLDRTLDIAKDALRVPPDDAVIGNLSGGEKRRVALTRLLLQSPDILLLDEPTNHLDAESVLWLELFLKNFAGTVVAITHDRYFLDNVAGWILELEFGKSYPFEGNYSAWLENKQKRLEVEEKQESKRQKYLKRELEWSRTTPKARATKSRARLQRLEALSAVKTEERGEAQIQIAPAPALGDIVVEAEGLQKAFGDKLLYDDLTFRIPKNAIVGVIGANGTGKTTLFRMITGQEQPDAGKLRIGERVKISYVDQSRDALDPTKTVFEEIAQGHDMLDMGNGSRMHARSYVGLFNFRGPDQQKFVGQLSGGERNRVHLAKLLRRGGNLLLLDEPSNDLDIDTLRALEEAILAFEGCVMVSSHDRWFLDRVATHILAFEGDSRTYWFEGNFELYELQKKERLGVDADQPHRIRYKPLSRT
ncbi:MAG: energy-dependent translational throttle protein EttA [Planctomycetaceae bacterium]|nr:energy-dependent translational throttle protein EttA [Planctomycetaceae bacterium]